MTEEPTVTRTKEKVRELTAQELGLQEPELNGMGRPTGRILGGPKKKRRSLYEQALVGDLVVAFIEDDGELKPGIVAIEQVRDGVGGDDIFDRWVAQGVTTDARVKVEVWEARPGFHFRKRKAGR